MKFYFCSICGSPPSNEKAYQNGNTAVYRCSRWIQTESGSEQCRGLIPVDLEEVFEDKIAEPCLS